MYKFREDAYYLLVDLSSPALFGIVFLLFLLPVICVWTKQK